MPAVLQKRVWVRGSRVVDSLLRELRRSVPERLMSSAMMPQALAPAKAEKKLTPQAGLGWPWKVTAWKIH